MGAMNALFLFAGILLLLGVLASTLSSRLGVPLLLLFLALGMLAGTDGIGGVAFDDFQLAFVIGNLALAVILLDGGLRTKISTFRAALWPSGMLATVGVILTAGLVGAFAVWALDVEWYYGLLLGSIVASTDAAAVFNVMRHGGIRLNERVGSTLEIESGANDPMAIFLVTLFIEWLSSPQHLDLLQMTLRLLQQFGFGAVAGLVGGWALVQLMRNLRLADGLYSLMVVSGGLVVFSATNIIGGSGFLAIYLTGLIVGNQRARASEHVIRVMDGLAWLAQAGMFLILGLLVTPSHLSQHAWQALWIATFLMLVARPLAVWVSLLPFHFPRREMYYISWVGLRGAVPIVLAVFPVMAGLPNSHLLFDVTFMVVLVSLLVQGMTVAPLARKLRVLLPHRARPLDQHDLWINREDSLPLVAFKVEPESPAVGHKATQLTRGGLQGVTVLLVRQRELLMPDADTVLQAGDEAWVLVLSGEVEQFAESFSREDQQGALAVRNFFGEFVLNADSPVKALTLLYGVVLSEAESQGTIADLLARRLARSLVVGDGIQLDSVRLTVRSMDGSKVVTVGLKLLPGRG